MLEFLKRHKNLVTFVLITTILLAVQFIAGIDYPRFAYYDASAYYIYGVSMFESGHFSLFDLASDFRGTIFPFFTGLCWHLDSLLGIHCSFIILSSIILGVLLTVYLNFCEKLYKRYVPNHNKQGINSIIFRRIIPIALMLVFFYGLVLCALTDLYSALLCMAAAYAIFNATDGEVPLKKRLLLYLLAGLLAYLAYNCRPIYLFSLITLLVYVLVHERKNIKHFFASAGVFIGGVLTAAIPQILINIQNHGKFSIFVDNENLFAKQLFYGIRWSRYATFVGDEAIHKPAMYFEDATGESIYQAFKASGQEVTVFNFFGHMLQYPLEYLAIIGKHIWNSIFILWPEQYITEIGDNRYPLAILSLVVIFTFIVITVKAFKKYRPQLKNILLILCMVLPTIAILFGAVEERFLILPYLLIYAFIAFFDYRKFFHKITARQIITITVCFIIFSLTALAIEDEILASLSKFPISFQ